MRNINSELTLVLFSRTFYEAKSINEFPEDIQSALHLDGSGRIYEDFYRVMVHNERGDDWMPMLASLKQIMWQYNQSISSCHQADGRIPKGYNSKAADGNLLEAINMSLNVFDNHYVNRNFDRTGQVVEIITPGAGVFHVDRTLCDITKHRMIDYGIGSDLVCLAEQPPHPVPLLLFSDDEANSLNSTSTHHIPYWLNYSFYLSPSQRQRHFSSAQSHFIPKFRLPTKNLKNSRASTNPNGLPKLPPKSTNGIHYPASHDVMYDSDYEIDECAQFDRSIFKVHNMKTQKCNNPFVPASLTTKLTPDRRRWTHTFPHGPHGDVIQLHHKHSLLSSESTGNSSSDLISSSSSASSLFNESAGEETTNDDSPNRMLGLMVNLKRRIGCGWGITGEQAWTPFLQTGVDWKSLTATACFPITTDFYPDNKTLETDFHENPQTLDIIPEDGEETAPSGKTIQSVFEELISQRLIQNYQLILLPKSEIANLSLKGSSHLPLVTNPDKHVFILSYGQTYHKISLKPDMKSIEIVRYTKRKQRTTLKLGYSYRLWPICKSGYEISHTRIFRNPVDNKWNHRDNYICLGGAAMREGFDLQESLKFWRSRFILLPSASSLMRKLCDQSYQGPLDVFEERTESQKMTLQDGFLRFVEGLNRRRRAPSRPPSKRPSVAADPNAGSTSRRLMPRSSGSGDSTPTSFQPNLSLNTATITSALAGISIARGKEDGSGVFKSYPSSPEREKLSLASPLSYITTKMRDLIEGMNFITGDVKGLPHQGDCFVSADGVAWVRKTFAGSVTHKEAMALMQVILEEGYIRAVFSSAAKKTFIYGYYIYQLTPEVLSPDSKRPRSSTRERRSPLAFTFDPASSSQWFEVSCEHINEGDDDDGGEMPSRGPSVEDKKGVEGSGEGNIVDSELGKSADEKNEDDNKKKSESIKPSVYKSLFLEIDSSKLADRVEWCHVGYHSDYNVDMAFEIELQWLTSTPSLLHELFTNWARRAVTCGFHLVPTHLDPFGFNVDISDSLHSPLFIELQLPKGYLHDRGGLEEGSQGLENARRIQQMIIQRFGFLSNQTSCYSPLASNTQSSDHSSLPIHHQYIHTTGCVFLLVMPFNRPPFTPRAEQLPCLCKLGSLGSCRDGQDSQESYVVNSTAASNHGRQLSGFTHHICQSYGGKLGFLYMHNYLLTKKWRSSATGDEKFHESLLADLCQFCSGEDGRLGDLLAKMSSCEEAVESKES